MRTSKAIGLYAVAVILLGALLAPWLFWILQALAAHISIIGPLARQPFHRIFDRALLIVAFAGLWPFLRYAGFRSWSDVGYVKTRDWWRHILAGFALGVSSLGLVIAITVLLGTRSLNLDRSIGQIVGAILRYLLTGAVVALIEETFFRGALQGTLQRGMKVGVAVILTSVIYSAVHFVKPKHINIPADQVAWSSGLTCLSGIVSPSSYERNVFVGFVTLFLAGVFWDWLMHGRRHYISPLGCMRDGSWPTNLRAGWGSAESLKTYYRGLCSLYCWYWLRGYAGTNSNLCASRGLPALVAAGPRHSLAEKLSLLQLPDLGHRAGHRLS